MPPKTAPLTRDQLEARRLLGARLLLAGHLSQAQIARRLGVSRASVNTWARQLAQHGLPGLQRHKIIRPIRLTPTEQAALDQHLEAGPRAAGFDTDRWTLARVAELIHREFGVHYHPRYINRLLASLGRRLPNRPGRPSKPPVTDVESSATSGDHDT